MANGSILSVRQVEDVDSAIVEIWDGDGVLSVSMGTQPAIERIIITDERGVQYDEPLGYGRQLVTGLWGDLVVVSPTSRYEIRAFRGDGSLDRIVRRDHVLRSPTEADREPFVEDGMTHILTVFDPTGQVLGFVETPEGLRIFEIGEDYILGRTEDEFEVESVQIWPLER